VRADLRRLSHADAAGIHPIRNQIALHRLEQLVEVVAARQILERLLGDAIRERRTLAIGALRRARLIGSRRLRERRGRRGPASRAARTPRA
jgi:hypothetical protein